MLTVTFILIIGALIAAIVSAMGKCPLWVSVVLLCIVMAIQVLPVK
jgi:hypothetical protein